MSAELPGKQALLDTAARIAPYIHETPVLHSRLVDAAVGAHVYFKCENFQRMGAFKMRGATNAILQLSDEARAKGVTTHSSGNFAQAVALAAKELGVKATIVMPENAPRVKKAAVLDYGAEVIDCESTLAARESTMAEVAAQRGATALHPYNDWDTICGQGTAAMELLKQQPDLDILITPIGGGGLIAGTCLAAHHFAHGVRVIGAEPAGADDAWRSFTGGTLVPQENPQTMADGLRTSLGDFGFAVMQQHLEQVLLVSEDEIVHAMRLVWERMKMIIESSSAVPLAAIIKNPEIFAGKRVGLIVSGGNVDLSALPF